MMTTIYIPERGDAVWIMPDSLKQAEHIKRAPAVVISPAAYNQKAGLVILCPITDQVKGYPFEVIIPAGLALTGAILSDQVKSLNWRMRNGTFICKIPSVTVTEVLQKMKPLLSVAPT
jgi:mRNA interferase MazF